MDGYNDQNNNQGGTIMGKLSFIFGIVGMVCSISICCSFLGFPFGVAALVLGIICIALAVAGTIISTVSSIGSSLTQYISAASNAFIL